MKTGVAGAPFAEGTVQPVSHLAVFGTDSTRGPDFKRKNL
jgi:hypothetical protein